jgi:ketosteroid isomerase-like protein
VFSQANPSGRSEPVAPRLSAGEVDEALSKEFAAREQEWMSALRNRDYKKTESFLAPEYVLIVSDIATRPISREQWIRNLPQYNLHEFTQRDIVARRVGDTVVVSLLHTQKATVGSQGRRMDRSGEFWIIDVWRRVDGQWKVASRYSGIGEPTPGAPPSRR